MMRDATCRDGARERVSGLNQRNATPAAASSASATWVIRDGTRKIRTGCAGGDREGAERALADYIARKYQAPRESGRHPAEILVLDVLNIYAADAVRKHKRPNETMQRLLTLGSVSRLAHAGRC